MKKELEKETTWESPLEVLDEAFEYAKEQSNITPKKLMKKFKITMTEAMLILATIDRQRKETRGLI